MLAYAGMGSIQGIMSYESITWPFIPWRMEEAETGVIRLQVCDKKMHKKRKKRRRIVSDYLCLEG